jgi:hypothetical protein
MKVINCFVLSIFLFIAGCGNFEWFPADKTAKFPVLTKAFSTASAIIGSPVTLTFTITNALGNPTQTGLGFTDTLPAGTTNSTIGMFVANPPTASTTCAGGIISAISAGDTAVTFSGGTIDAGPATCTVTVQVTSNASTTNLNQSFHNNASNISVVGNLNNTVTDQLVAFAPVTQAITGGTLSARDLVVSLTGSPQFSLFIDNSSTQSANVTVTVIGKDSTGTTVSTVTVPATPVPVSAGATQQQLTLPAGSVSSTAITWQISSINVTP